MLELDLLFIQDIKENQMILAFDNSQAKNEFVLFHIITQPILCKISDIRCCR